MSRGTVHLRSLRTCESCENEGEYFWYIAEGLFIGDLSTVILCDECAIKEGLTTKERIEEGDSPVYIKRNLYENDGA